MRKHNYKNLEVWKKARVLVSDIYRISIGFPKEEIFGLTAQIRRAVISISLNIAEGSGRGTNKAFSAFLDISYGSALEVENILFICLDLKYISEKVQVELIDKVNEILKMINGLQKTLED